MAGTRKGNTDREAWVAIKLIAGEPEIIALCGSEEVAKQRVARSIADTCQIQRIVASKLPWRKSEDGVRLLYDREDRRFHFRLEPWPVET